MEIHIVSIYLTLMPASCIAMANRAWYLLKLCMEVHLTYVCILKKYTCLLHA